MFVLKPLARAVNTVKTIFWFGAGPIQTYQSLTIITSSDTVSNYLHRGTAGLGANIFLFGGIQSPFASYAAQTLIQRFNGVSSSTDGSTLAVARYAPACATIDTNAYVLGGSTGTTFAGAVTGAAQKYNGTTTSSAGNAYIQRTEACAAVLSDTMYIFGGKTAGNTYGINTVTTYTASTDSMANPSRYLTNSVRGASCATLGSNIFIFGGLDENVSIYTYRIQRNTTSALTTESAILAAGTWHSGAAANESFVYNMAGTNSTGNVTRLQQYSGTILISITSSLTGTSYDGCSAGSIGARGNI